MIVENIIYDNNKQLSTIIKEKNIASYKKVFVQIFTACEDKLYIKSIMDAINKDILYAEIVASSGVMEAGQTFISFTLLEFSDLTSDRDLQDRVKMKNIELHYNLYHDALTNLRNKTALIEDLKSNDFFYMAVVDIDSFQTYNDLYGFDGGNSIIKSFAKLLYENIDEQRYEIYRFHNDQFILRALKMKKDGFDKEINSILKTIKSFRIDTDYLNDQIEVDITVGITKVAEQAIERSFMALNYAKKHKKQYQVYNEIIDSIAQSKDMNFWNREIKRAIVDDRIVPVYQPIVNSFGKTIKHEALMRMVSFNNGVEKLISPFLFLDVAVKTKQYLELTKIMIEKSFGDMSKIGSDFSINLSYEDIQDEKTIKMLKNQVIKHNVGKLLIMEIVESENVDDYEKVKDFIREFQKLGVRVAIDDFGSGFSNYLHILELNPDYLKIDGSLIKNIDKSEKSYQLVKSIVGLSKSLKIKTIAEYVHSKEVFEICKKVGIDEFQGFYFSPPVKKEQMEQEKVLA